MITSFRAAALLVVLATGANSLASVEPISLRRKFIAGESQRYRLTQSQSMESELVGTIESRSAFVYRQRADEVASDGTATLAVSYEALKLDIGGPRPMSYDSTRTGDAAAQNDPTFARVFAPILEAKLGMKMSATGRVTELTGFQELLERALDAGPDTDASGTSALMKNAFNEDAMRKLFELQILPEQPVAPGATWPRTLDQQLPLLGTMHVRIDNTFVGVETRAGVQCAKVALTGEITVEKAQDPGALPFEFTLAAPELKGESYLALDDGRLIDSQMTTTMTAKATAKGDAAAGFEMEMRMAMSQRMQLLGDKEPAFE